MRRVTWIVLFAVAGVGCMKSKPREASGDVVGVATPEAGEKPKPAGGGGNDTPASRVAKTQGNLSVKGGEGVGAVRSAVGRTVNDVQLGQLRLSIFQAMQADPGEKPPSLDEVKQMVRENPQLQRLVNDEVVILTGTQRKDGVFAYTLYPQRAGSHYAVTTTGVESMTPGDLKQRLEAQGSTVKLAK